MTKKELVKYIENHSGENESWGKLSSMNKSELEKIYNYLEKVNGLEYSEDYVDILEGERTLVDKTPSTAFSEDLSENFVDDALIGGSEPKPIKISDEYVDHKKPSSLSVNEIRALKRSNRSIKKKENIYTRFEEEDVKFGF